MFEIIQVFCSHKLRVYCQIQVQFAKHVLLRSRRNNVYDQSETEQFVCFLPHLSVYG